MRLCASILCLVILLVSDARCSMPNKLNFAIDFAMARAKEFYPEARHRALDSVGVSNPLSLKYGITLKIDEKLCNIIVMEDEKDKDNFEILSDFQCT